MDNRLTAEGEAMHKRAHDEQLREHRGNMIVVRGLSVSSYVLGLSGICDVVELHRDSSGIGIAGEQGLWNVVPVEYKHGCSKIRDEDRLQLCAQALCLEEMLGTDVPVGFLFYEKTRSRERVVLDKDLRVLLSDVVSEMHEIYKRGHIPNVKATKACRSCSLADLCLPKRTKQKTVGEYLALHLAEEGS